MARPKTKTRMEVRVNSELLAALDDLIEPGETRTDLIEEGLRSVVATRRSKAVRRDRLAKAEKERRE
jgi:metal-responsive CopG/Arc/MetJ family transcriptional regulator